MIGNVALKESTIYLQKLYMITKLNYINFIMPKWPNSIIQQVSFIIAEGQGVFILFDARKSIFFRPHSIHIVHEGVFLHCFSPHFFNSLRLFSFIRFPSLHYFTVKTLNHCCCVKNKKR